MKEDMEKYIYGGRFTSREDWIHPDRQGMSFELILVNEGTVWIEEDGKTFVLSPGMTLLLEPGKRHRGVQTSHQRVSFYWIHFKNYNLSEHNRIEKCMELCDSYAVTLLCRQLVYYGERKFDSSVLDALLHVLLAELKSQGGQKTENSNALSARIREWIRINSDRNLTVSDISEHFGYNVDYLSRLYRKNYGYGLKAEIDALKLREIKKLLLETDLTLYEISDRMGMGDYKLFLKFFKYHEGVTASDFRKLYHVIHTNNR